MTIDQEFLAHCILKIIAEGPSKRNRVPLIVGPTNSMKSTLLNPVEEVFGFSRGLHGLPADWR